MNTGRLKGSVVGGRQDNAVYIPDIYSRTQNAWVDAFLQQNGYLGAGFEFSLFKCSLRHRRPANHSRLLGLTVDKLTGSLKVPFCLSSLSDS